MRDSTFLTRKVATAHLALAISDVLHAVLVEEGSETEETYLLFFDAEAATPGEATRNALREIFDLIDEHRATVRACEVSGLRRTDTGYRLWGTIECAAAGQSTRVDAAIADTIRIEQDDAGRWTISMRGGE